MNLFLDQGIPRSTASILRDAGFDAIHAGEIDLAEAEDSEILQAAVREARIVVTLDADFHALLAISQAKGPSVIRIRIEGLRADDVSLLIQYVLSECKGDLEAGAMVSVNKTQVRVRRLPVV